MRAPDLAASSCGPPYLPDLGVACVDRSRTALSPPRRAQPAGLRRPLVSEAVGLAGPRRLASASSSRCGSRWSSPRFRQRIGVINRLPAGPRPAGRGRAPAVAPRVSAASSRCLGVARRASCCPQIRVRPRCCSTFVGLAAGARQRCSAGADGFGLALVLFGARAVAPRAPASADRPRCCSTRELLRYEHSAARGAGAW